MDVNQTYCNDHFTIYTDIESCRAPDTNIMLYVNYISILKKDRKIATLTKFICKHRGDTQQMKEYT